MWQYRRIQWLRLLVDWDAIEVIEHSSDQGTAAPAIGVCFDDLPPGWYSRAYSLPEPNPCCFVRCELGLQLELEPAWLPRSQRSQWILVFAWGLRHLDHFLDAGIPTHWRIDNESIGIRIDVLIA
jgi:hypothetical protein